MTLAGKKRVISEGNYSIVLEIAGMRLPKRRTRLLVFSFFPCFFPPKSGGESRLYNIYHNLSKTFEIRILSSSHLNEDTSIVVHSPFFVEHRFGKNTSFADCYAALMAISDGGDLSGLAVGLYGSFPNDLHIAYSGHHDWADIIIHESPFTISFDLMLGLDCKPRVYNAYNAEHVLMRSLHPGEAVRHLHTFAEAAERMVVNAADLVAYCAEEDRRELECLVGRPIPRGLLVPNGGTLPAGVPATPGMFKSPARRLVFLGSRHAPNVEAARFLIEQLAPRLPDLELHIVGACAAPGRPQLNVVCHGEVSAQQKADILGKSDIALNPMVSGSGSNLKVLDYMAVGLPVVATAFGMRGTAAEAGRHYVQADLAGFADAVARLAVDDDARTATAAAGFRHIRDHLTWPAIARGFGDALDALTVEWLGTPSAKRANEAPLILCLNDYDPTSGFGGGATRMLGLQRALSEHELVVLLCIHDGETIERTWLASRHLVIKVPKTAGHRVESHRVDALFHVSSADIVSCRFAVNNPILMGLYGMLRRRARIVVLEHPYMAPLAAHHGDRFVYSSQNDEYAMKHRMLAGHPEHAALLETVREVEDFCLRAARLTIAVSDHDADAFACRRRSTGGPILVVPNGADAPSEPTSEDLARAAIVGARSVVFLGSAHMPNIEALWLLRDVVAPALPDVEFHILGTVGGSAGAVPANVRIWNEVGPGLKTAILWRAAVALNPVYSGGGSNVKMSDYFAHGLPTVTSAFGQRGYPPSIEPFVETADVAGFAAAVVRLLARFPPVGEHRRAIAAIFARQLSMAGHAARYAHHIRAIDTPRRRLLAVTYRYTDPALGGAEVMLRELLSRLDATGRWAIDIVCPDVGAISDRARFTCNFGDAEGFATPRNLVATRWRRFAVQRDAPIAEDMLAAWRLQAAFEQALADDGALAAAAGVGPRLLAGWHNAESDADGVTRWMTNQATFHTGIGGKVRLCGWAPRPMEFSLACGPAILGARVDGAFEFTAEIQPGVATLSVEARQLDGADMRLLGLRLTHLGIGDRSLLAGPTLVEDLPTLPFVERMRALNRAARATRWPAGLDLTRLRGPRSAELRDWIRDNVGKYDIMLTHNCVFLPPVEALELAREQGVPSVFIPHIHLDDDFYHFPDVARAIEEASVTLVSPRAAVDFLHAEVSRRVRYFGAGADPAEFAPELAEHDLAAVRERLADDGMPLILVLGRKAAAKNYAMTLTARRRLDAEGVAARVVMIGPDDDGVPVDEDGVVYLGLQSRAIVRGALRAAHVLVNMSASESFGIVLLEAWLAGTPVVANRRCIAFTDLVDDGVNGFLADDSTEVAERIAALLTNPALGIAMAARGREVAMGYAWSLLGDELETLCTQLADEAMAGTTRTARATPDLGTERSPSSSGR
jgi:glycosyltransferase involved in cell wall biosynthesis